MNQENKTIIENIDEISIEFLKQFGASGTFYYKDYKISFYPDRDTGVTEIIIYDNKDNSNRIFDEFTESSIINLTNNEEAKKNSYEELKNTLINAIKSMNNEQLKKIIKEVIGNNDPFWNNLVFEVVKQIIEMPAGTESSITKLLGNSQYSSKQLFDIYLCVNKVCKKLNIVMDFSRENAKVDGLLYNLPFVKKEKKIPVCPNCGERLMFLMPDGQVLSCDKCNKYYKNNNGEIGDETSSPYTRNDVLY